MRLGRRAHLVCLTYLSLWTVSVAPLAAQQAARQWIVDNAATSTGDGSPASPFQTIAEAVKAAGEGDTILVSGSDTPYSGGIALGPGQSIAGSGAPPLITAAEGDVLSVTGGGAPVSISNLVVRASGKANGIVLRDVRAAVTLTDLDVATADGAALSAAGVSRLVVGGGSTLAAVNAPAVLIEGAELDVTLRSVSAKGERLTHGIVLRGTTGRFTVEGVEDVAGSGGTIQDASVRAISAENVDAMTLRHMNILRSASVNGASGTQCGSDLTASQPCNAAVHLVDVSDAILDSVHVDGSGQIGVYASRTRGLALLDSTIRNAGDELFENGIVLHEVTGLVRLVGTTIARSASRQLMLYNSSGRLAFVMERSRLEEAGQHGQQGALLTAEGNAAIDLAMRESVFAGAKGAGLEVTAAQSAEVQVRVSGSRFDRNGLGLSLSALNAARVEYAIVDNPSITVTAGTAVNVFLGSPSSGSISGTIARNIIGDSRSPGSGGGCVSCSAISLSATGNGELIADVSGNVVQQAGGTPLHAGATQGGARLHLTATANLLREGNATAPAIRVQSGAMGDDATHVCADLGGPGAKANKIEGTWDTNGAIHVIHRFGRANFELAGLSGGTGDAAAASALAARNGGVKVRAVLRPESIEKGFQPAERCAMPELAQ